MKRNNKKSLIYLILAMLIFDIFLISMLIIKNTTQHRVYSTKSTPSALADLKSICDKNTPVNNGVNNNACYANYFLQLSEKKGYDYAFKMLMGLQKKDKSIVQCHLLAHQIGRGVYRNAPEKWRNALAEASPSCSRGFAHGLIEGYLADLPEGRIFDRNILREICDERAPLSCYHVIGHVVLLEQGGKLQDSLQTCNVFPKQPMVKNCVNGVFMGYMDSSALAEHGLEKKSIANKDRLPLLENICKSYTDELLSFNCWGEIALPAVSKYNHQPEAVFEFCNKANIPLSASSCRRRAIEILIGRNVVDLNAVKHICLIKQPQEPDFEKNCYGKMADVGIQVLPITRANSIVKFCSSLQLDFQRYCFSTIGGTIRGRATLAEIKHLCRTAPTVFRAQCEGSSG